MGEVYHAHDQILNQAVALEFLAHTGMSEAALGRFRNEVRIARQVSHPNVCRVYDIGQIEGMHFLSMEYLDGEDLGSLLAASAACRRIRLSSSPVDLRGFSAAHEREGAHRDLDEATGRHHDRRAWRSLHHGFWAGGGGREIPLSDIRSGTPAYMSRSRRHAGE